jgi:hypothetical protein
MDQLECSCAWSIPGASVATPEHLAKHGEPMSPGDLAASVNGRVNLVAPAG